MNRMKALSVTAAAVALLSFSVPFSASAEMRDRSHGAQRGGHGHMMEMGSMDEMMGMCLKHAEKIGLSDEQSSKLKPIHREMQKKQVRFKAEQKIAEIELMEIMDVKDFDLEKAKSTMKKCADLSAAHHLEMLTAMKEARTILTDDQFKKMKKLMAMNMGEKRPAKKMMKK